MISYDGLGESMTTTVIETSGTVHPDGRLELDQKVTVPPGKVKVTVESIEGESTLEARFRELARQWKEATLLLSSITEMATHPAYQQIIGMGRAALPWIFGISTSPTVLPVLKGRYTVKSRAT
jgi:hypothetical protein